MGHSSIKVTLDTYGHLFPEADEAVAEALGRAHAEGAQRADGRGLHAGPRVLDGQVTGLGGKSLTAWGRPEWARLRVAMGGQRWL